MSQSALALYLGDIMITLTHLGNCILVDDGKSYSLKRAAYAAMEVPARYHLPAPLLSAMILPTTVYILLHQPDKKIHDGEVFKVMHEWQQC